MKIRSGDTVKILAGKDRGKTGKVLSIRQKSGRATVEGRNIFVRHQRPRRANEKGQIIQVPGPIDLSNLLLVCPSCKKPARIGSKTDDKGRKVRVCKKCGKAV